jgi:hypothetical protein
MRRQASTVLAAISSRRNFLVDAKTPFNRRDLDLIARSAILRPRLAPAFKVEPFGCCATLTPLAMVA